MYRGMMLSPIAIGPRNDFQLRPSGKWHVDLEKSKGLIIIIAFCFSDPLFFLQFNAILLRDSLVQEED